MLSYVFFSVISPYDNNSIQTELTNSLQTESEKKETKNRESGLEKQIIKRMPKTDVCQPTTDIWPAADCNWLTAFG